MKVLVTGGAGFIGSHLVEELIRQKHKVLVLDNLSSGNLKNLGRLRKKIKFIKCDLSKGNNLYKILFGVDYVYHLAGLVDVVESLKKPILYFNTNVKGTLNILKAAQKANVKKFIYAASASCYGNSKKLPTPENAKINILSPYALTKWLGELLVLHWSKKYRLPAISLRLFNVYGSKSKNQKGYDAVINIFIRQKFLNKPLTIVGDGFQTRNFVYVRDVVNAMILASNSKISGEIFNVGAKKSISINNIAKFFKTKKIYIKKRKGELKHSSANTNKIMKMLKWKPKTDIQKGLNTLLEKI